MTEWLVTAQVQILVGGADYGMLLNDDVIIQDDFGDALWALVLKLEAPEHAARKYASYRLGRNDAGLIVPRAAPAPPRTPPAAASSRGRHGVARVAAAASSRGRGRGARRRRRPRPQARQPRASWASSAPRSGSAARRTSGRSPKT